jgi:hypothetical protein
MDRDRSLVANCKVTTVKVASASLSPGAGAQLDVTVQNVPASGLASFNLGIAFNPAVLQVTGVSPVTAPFNPVAFNIDNVAGTAALTSAAASGPTSGDVIVARLSVSVAGAAGAWSSIDVTINELLDNSLAEITPRQDGDGLVTVGAQPEVQQSIGQALEDVAEGGVTRKKVWVTLRADGALLGATSTTLQGGVRHVEAAISYSPSCMTVLAAKGTAPFTTTASAIDGSVGTVWLVVDVPAGTSAVALPAEFGRLLVRLTGPANASCSLSLTTATTYKPGAGAGFPAWAAYAAAPRSYLRGDVLGLGTVKSRAVTQTVAILQYLVGRRSLDTIQALNAASIKPDPISGGDNGDQISTADAVLLLRYAVGSVNDYFVTPP